MSAASAGGPQRLIDFVRDVGIGVIATAAADGSPQAALVGFAIDADARLIFDSLSGARKIVNLRGDDRVAVVISRDDVSVQVEGRAQILTGEERMRAGAVYLEQFPGSRALHEDFALVRIDVDWSRWYDAGS